MRQGLTCKLPPQFDDHLERHLDSEVEADRFEGQPLDTENALSLVLQHVRVDVRYINRSAALAHELGESDAITRNDDISRFLQRIVQFRRDIEGRQGNILDCQLPREGSSFWQLTTNWNSAYGKNRWKRMYNV